MPLASQAAASAAAATAAAGAAAASALQWLLHHSRGRCCISARLIIRETYHIPGSNRSFISSGSTNLCPASKQGGGWRRQERRERKETSQLAWAARRAISEGEARDGDGTHERAIKRPLETHTQRVQQTMSRAVVC